MYSAAHTQILLYQYFKNDSDDPLAFKGRSDLKLDQAQNQLKRMIEGLNALNFEPKVESLLPPPKNSLRNYSYPQFEVHRARDDGKASRATLALKEAVNRYRESNPEALNFGGEDPWVSATRLISVRKDQKADHLNFNQFLALVVELPFRDLVSLRSFLEKDNYLVLKKEFLSRVWKLEVGEEVSSMPTYVFVGREEEEGSAVGEWVMDIPTPIYDLHTSTRKSCVERGYPYVNYIVHERVDNFIQYEYEYVDLGLAVFLHGYLDRDIKQRLQTQADGLTKLMGSLDGADEEKLSEDFKSFRKTATEAAKISGAVPEIEMMGRRLTEKYSSPNPRLLTIFQMIAGDNKEFLENSVGAVVQGTKALQDLFLVLFEKRSEEHRGRIESFLKLISAFAVVMVLKEIWLRDDAQSVFTRVGAVLARWHLRWPSMITVHPGYFYSSFLIGAGLSAVLGLYIIFDERWKLHWFKRILALLAPLVLSMFGWLKWPFPKWGLLGLLTGLALAALISIRVGGSSKRRFWFLLASLPFYTWLVLYVGCYLLNIVP